VIAKRAVDFIHCANDLDDKQPFFMYVAPTAPHLPIAAAPRHRAQQRLWQAEHKRVYKRRKNYKEDDFTDKPEWLQASLPYRQKDLENFGSILVHADWHQRMGSLYAVEEMIAGIIQALKDTGEWENTIFIFSSDNGYLHGAHWSKGKWLPYEESLRVPMVIRGKGIRAGYKAPVTAARIDVAPMILDLAQVPIPEHMDGRSLVPHFSVDQSRPKWRRDALLLRCLSNAAYPLPK
jgi:N-acetylglucosamine-6-sulfatase